MLNAISPIDGRYSQKTQVLQDYFSESALIRYRVKVEVLYLKELLLQLNRSPNNAEFDPCMGKLLDLDDSAIERVKTLESRTNHDVKAVEYLIRETMDSHGLSELNSFVHFGLTSQDINNTAFPLMIMEAHQNVLYPALDSIIKQMDDLAFQWIHIPMLARTHGQPASPTSLGKEIQVFVARLNGQLAILKSVANRAKFGGATGNFNAHIVAYPDTNWSEFANRFVNDILKLERTEITTQIEPYDHLAAQCHAWMRINTIFIDFCRDIWTYVSMEYFKQKIKEGEVGSSAMPHKVNPIDFENAEGNLGLANAILSHLAEKLPISRLQRDLTDSTVLRNIGVPYAHILIAISSIEKGLGKLLLNEQSIHEDLNNNWAVIAEAIQTILRREGQENAYELLKDFTRNHHKMDQKAFALLIDQLAVSAQVKQELNALTPFNYIGNSSAV